MPEPSLVGLGWTSGIEQDSKEQEFSATDLNHDITICQDSNRPLVGVRCGVAGGFLDP
jgi:hypothetical protein